MDFELLKELARHQIWADAEHWKALHGSPALIEDEDIRKRLNHMVTASEMLQALARGESAQGQPVSERGSAQELETAMTKANRGLCAMLATADLERMIALPRGPNGPFQAPAHVLLLQVMTHSQYHRAQNAARMRAIGVTPPMTDYVFWYASGRPEA